MDDKPISEQINEIINKYGGWKGNLLSRLRLIILQSEPDAIEEIKWRIRTRPEGLPVWSKNGILCFAETWKDNIKLLFPKGAKIDDPENLFNSRLQSKDIRAIEFKEDSKINEKALINLVHKAAEINKPKN